MKTDVAFGSGVILAITAAGVYFFSNRKAYNNLNGVTNYAKTPEFSKIQDVDGTILELLPNKKYKIKLDDDSETEVFGFRGKTLKKNNVRLLVGDKVNLSLYINRDSKYVFIINNRI
jgi:translation initiation factor IF-1